MTKQEKIKTGVTDFEKQEGKENELDEITRDFLKNAHPDEIQAREIEQEKLQNFLKEATKEEIDYAQSLIRLKGIQYYDWTEQGFPMKEKEIKTIKEYPAKQKSGIKVSKMIPETKKVPSTFFSITENDVKMMDILNNPDKLEKSDQKEKQAFKEWIEKYEGFATSDEQQGETQKFVNAHEKIPENQAIEIQNLVSRAFPEYFCVQRPWKKKEEKKEDIDSSFLPDIGDNYAA